MNLKVGRASPLRAVCALPNCGAHGVTRPTGSRSQCTRQCERGLSMNRRFGVPALAGPDRLKAGHQTNLATQSGSRSQCTAKKPRRLSMNLKVGRVSPLRAVCALPNCGAHGVTRPTGSWSPCMRKNERRLSTNRTKCEDALASKAAEDRRTPRPWRVGHSRLNLRQVLECAAPAAFWIFRALTISSLRLCQCC